MKDTPEEKETVLLKKIKQVGKLLKKRVEHTYEKYQIRKIQRGKQRMIKKKYSTPEEYRQFLLNDFRRDGWKEVLFYVVFLLLVIFLLTSIVKGFQRLLHPAPEAVETEAETETEKIYPERDITIGSTGCMLLHSPFIDSYPDAEGNYDFSSIYKFITPYYSAPDFMTCEFEGSLGGEEMGYSGYPMFISPDIIIQNIRDSGVDLQMLASNHIYDGWSYGFHRTMEVYEKLGIAYTGIRKSAQDKPFYLADINGVRVGFLNYVYETPGDGTNLNGIALEEEDWDLINSFDYDDLDAFYKEIEQNIHAMREEGARFIIAQMHWGIEYQLQEADYQDEIAQKLCDLGVDAIIGGHPHCEQPIDVVESSDGTKKIFCIYSEGNALSNQRTYLMDEMPTGHTEDGVMATLRLHQSTDGNVTLTGVDILPTWVYRYQDSSGSKYYILPLDDVDSIEETTGIADVKEEAKASYERTMEELRPGLEKVKEVFGGSISQKNLTTQIGI